MRNISMAETVRKKAAKKSTGKKRGRPKKVQDPLLVANAPKKVEFPSVAKEEVFVPTTTTASQMQTKREKNAFERNFGEGTAFDLDYGKLLIIALCIYIAVQVS
jgi:hypothetical protein